MEELHGKVAAVTGAGSGIGRALALRFAAEGMCVAAIDLDPTTAAETAALATGAGHAGEVVADQADVTDPASLRAAADRTFERWGAVDVLCNNAGVFVGGYLWDRPAEDMDFVMGVNVGGVLNGIAAFVPRMIHQDTEGHIVNTVSVSGLFGSPYSGPYTISKFAAFAVTEVLAHDLESVGSKLKVSALCPGIIATNIADATKRRLDEVGATDDQRFVSDVLAGSVPVGLDPADVAGCVVDGIRAERFVILTHDHFAQDLAARTEALVTGVLPAIPDFL
jgi:NAD(P)-dependent dehydrogenase (short-subunit alcohol dehydrogenase family)